MRAPGAVGDALRAGFGRGFMALLEQWGRWSRFTGCRGFSGGQTPAGYAITDEEALYVDRAVQKLKASRPQVHRLFAEHYIHGLDTLDLMRGRRAYRRLNRRAVWRYSAGMGVIPALLGARTDIGESEIRDMIGLGERLVFNFLLEMEDA